MTPQERDVLLPLLDKLRQARLPEKDVEAERYIHEAGQEQPDLAYILTQTVLMQDYALHAAQDRIHALESQSQQSQSSSGGFLSGLFGGGRSSNPQPSAGSGQGPWGGAPRQPYAQPMAAQSGQPSFLRSAAQTAAGIAGGALLFSGIESLFGMGRGGFGGGFLGGGGFGSGMVENNTEVVNNYYDQSAPDQSGGGDYADASDTGSDFGGDGGGSFDV